MTLRSGETKKMLTFPSARVLDFKFEQSDHEEIPIKLITDNVAFVKSRDFDKAL